MNRTFSGKLENRTLIRHRRGVDKIWLVGQQWMFPWGAGENMKKTLIVVLVAIVVILLVDFGWKTEFHIPGLKCPSGWIQPDGSCLSPERRPYFRFLN